MAEIKFTKEQESAINTSDKTLLVSAAAGAGKTSTLTERIIRSLTRKENPDDISKMLIVTFTNAATAQLCDDIREAIEKALKNDPENRALERQLTLLPMAKISTIDSFCNDILRKNCDKVGIPPNYRIAETAELEILSLAILSELIDAIYENESEIMTAADFARLADALTSSKSDAGLESIFLKLYEKSKSAVPGVEIFKILADKYNGIDVKNNEFTRHAIQLFKEAAQHHVNILTQNANELISSDDKYEKAYAEAFFCDAELLKSLLSEDEYFSLKNALDEFKFKTFPSVKAQDKTPFLEAKKALHKDASDEIRAIRSKYFFYTEEELRELFKGLYDLLSLLAKFLAEFDRIYMQRKIKRLTLEYSDIERFAYASLYNEDGSISDFANALKKEYSSVYIDEYQDVNALQAKIFDAISRPDNRFMVGDIKQSIYGFRSADPDVFASMKKSFPKLDSGESSSSFSIFMSQNFRSDRCIIDFVNSVFDKVFGLAGESIGYLPDDRLLFAKASEPTEYKNVSFLLVPEKPSDAEKNALSAEELECETVAKKIDEILKKNKDLSPSDFAIIMRGKSRMGDYSDALKRRGIPSENLDSKNFFLNSEVLLALCLLNSIDNPEKDIYLAGLMASPLFSFTADELYAVRKDKKTSLYKSLISYTEENPSFKKGRDFIERLEFYRTLSEGLNIDAFILRLYNDTGLLDLARRFGEEDNLLLLYNYAKSFSSSGPKSLYSFIKFINNVIDNNTEFNAKRDGDKKDAVNITTVHSSKGLEYKIVFYVDTNTPFKDLDSTARIAFSEKFALSLCLRSPGGLARVENPIHNIVIHSNYMRYFEEELRVIYVALTRAKSELFIVGKTPEDYTSFLTELEFGARFLDKYSVYKAKSPLSLMLMTGENYKTLIVRDVDEEILFNKENAANTPEISRESAAPENPCEREEEFEDDSFTLSADELSARLSFSYEKEYLTKIPEKMAVSILKPEVLDGSEKEKPAELIENLLSGKRSGKITPDFISGSAVDESAKQGIATHTFLQFFDIANFEEKGAREELERLCSLKFISKANKDRVRLSEIELFKKSGFFAEMKAAKKVYREFRFNTHLPAKFFTTDEGLRKKLKDEELLVQGVIDCIIEDNDGNLHLVDYKTDRLSEAELQNKTLAERKLNDAHARQLSYYSLAAEKIFGKAPKSLRVYSLPLGDTVTIKKTFDV